MDSDVASERDLSASMALYSHVGEGEACKGPRKCFPEAPERLPRDPMKPPKEASVHDPL